MLCQEGTILLLLSAKILGFDHVKELYRDDTDFGMIYPSCLDGKATNDYYCWDLCPKTGRL